MIPYNSGAHYMVEMIAGRGAKYESRNSDFDWYLASLPVPTPEPWPMRMLPAFVRTALKARIAQRQYEKTLVNLWETSPHLLADIGVVLTPKGDLPDYLVAAPTRVIEHVTAFGDAHSAAVDDLPVAAPAPRNAKKAAPVEIPGHALPSGLMA
jgi:uncharacterized protein YjiS (DUF1127 family)